MMICHHHSIANEYTAHMASSHSIIPQMRSLLESNLKVREVLTSEPRSRIWPRSWTGQHRAAGAPATAC